MKAVLRVNNLDESRVLVDTAKSVRLCTIDIANTPKKEMYMTKNKLIYIFWKETKQIYLPNTRLDPLDFAGYDPVRLEKETEQKFRQGQQAAKDYLGIKSTDVYQKHFGRVKEG